MILVKAGTNIQVYAPHGKVNGPVHAVLGNFALYD